MGLRDRLLEEVETRTGYTFEKRDRLNYLEESDAERRAITRELDLLAYTALDYMGGAPQELRPEERRKLAQKSRVVWMRDPQAGAAVDLMNDFTFGRGLPRPKANDDAVQEVLDAAWDDPDNALVLTSYAAQVALGTDLSLQSNIFIQLFDDGDDGKVKLGVLDHDKVERVVRDRDNRLRITYYVAKQEEPPEEDWAQGRTVPRAAVPMKTLYFEHWRNVELAIEEADAGERERPRVCPAQFQGEGKVFHIAINRTVEMAFGHPTMDRLLRWYTAYNKFMDARVDIMEATAAFVMKRKVKGTPGQLRKMATQALSRSGSFGSSRASDMGVSMPPAPASVLVENEEVTHEDFKLSSGGAEAAQDAQMLRSQISAATRFPQSYYGDASNSNLATATSLELPVLKAVEARQEMFEQLTRFFLDRVIERAVDTGRISKELTPDEIAKARKAQQPKEDAAAASAEPPMAMGGSPLSLAAGYEDQTQDETQTERDLGYGFSMPSPLKRMMTDLITAVQTIAQTFDPNGTNVELSRTLLTIALGEGLEVEDPAKEVEKIFPPGYEDPMLKMQMQAAQNPPPGATGGFGPGGGPPTATGADGQQHGAANPYGGPMRSQPPELAMAQSLDELASGLVVRNRLGEPIRLLESHAARRVPEATRSRLDRRKADVEESFGELFSAVGERVLAGHGVNGTNGKGHS